MQCVHSGTCAAKTEISFCKVYMGTVVDPAKHGPSTETDIAHFIAIACQYVMHDITFIL